MSLIQRSRVLLFTVLASQTGSETVAREEMQKRNIDTRPLYFRKAHTDPSQDMIRAKDDEVVGEHPIQSDKLPAGDMYILGGLSIGTENNSETTAPAPGAVVYVDPTAPAVVNGQVVIKVGRRELLKVPVKAIIDAQQKSDEGYYALDGALEIIPGNERIEMTVESAEEVALPANNNNISVGWHGAMVTQINQQ